jgi:membrane peptidoglycan carboxypeptidase
MVFKGGLNVYTTLSPSMQLAAEQALREGLRALEGRTKNARPGEHPEGAVVTVDPQTGYIRALVGGYDFFRSEFNRAVKPSGSRARPSSRSSSSPPWNQDSRRPAASMTPRCPTPSAAATCGSRKTTTASTAAPPRSSRRSRSRSTSSPVKLQERIGVNRTVQVARRLGVTSPIDVNLSMALGTSDLTLLEMTSAYGVLANQGTWMPPTAIRYVTNAEGQLLEEHVPQGREALTPEMAYVITHMLRGVVERGTGQAAKALGRPIAAKTGTTNDYSNAWFIGFTPQLSTGVWVGYDRPRSLGKDETGSRVAVPIWVTYMTKVLGDSPKDDFPVPERVVLLPDRSRSLERVRARRDDGVHPRHRAGHDVRTAPPERADGHPRAPAGISASGSTDPARGGASGRAAKRHRRSGSRRADPRPDRCGGRPRRVALGPARLPLRAREVARDVRPGGTGIEETCEHVVDAVERHAQLLHGVALSNRDLAVAASPFSGSPTVFTFHRHAVRGPDLVLTPIKPADGRRIVVDARPSP